MPQLFPAWATPLLRATLIGVPATLILGAATWGVVYRSAYYTDVGEPLKQPVPFSHQHHVSGLGVDCRFCHSSVETSAFAGMPSSATCMRCHSQIWSQSAMLAPVRESYRSGQPLRWTRVNDLPDYVYFNHSIHVTGGVACVSCHGRVDQMPLLAKAQTLHMRFCLDCHRDPGRSVREGASPFAMDYQEIAANLPPAHPRLNRSLLDCTACHR
jgi:hypothetical protein